MQYFDIQILLWIQENLRNDYITPLLKFITALGNNGLIWIVATIVLLLMAKYRKVGYLSIISLVGSLVMNNLILKNLVARTRPYEVIEGLQHLIETQQDYSFPSGHTGAAFAAAVIFYIYLPKRYGISAIVLAVLISFSRLYVGVHYPSDVLAGAAIGTVIAMCIWTVERWKFSDGVKIIRSAEHKTAK